MRKLILLATCTIFTGACGSDSTPATEELAGSAEIPRELVGTWLEKPASADPERITVAENSRIVMQMPRQVGHEGSGIPYPTVCYYQLSGRIEHYGEPSEEKTSIYRDHGKPKPQMTLGIAIEKIEVLASPRNSSNCEEFARIQNQRFAEKPGPHFWEDFRNLTETTLVKAWSGIAYIKEM